MKARKDVLSAVGDNKHSPYRQANECLRAFAYTILIEMDCANDIQFLTEEYSLVGQGESVAMVVWCSHPFFCVQWLETFGQDKIRNWFDGQAFEYTLTDLGQRSADGRVGVRIVASFP